MVELTNQILYQNFYLCWILWVRMQPSMLQIKLVNFKGLLYVWESVIKFQNLIGPGGNFDEGNRRDSIHGEEKLFLLLTVKFENTWS